MRRRKGNLAEVIQTDVVGSMPLKTLAKVLQSKGRRGDTILAHITPKEAKKLKKAGGAGTTNPETGLPEFFDGEDFYGSYEPPVYTPVETPAPVEAPVSQPAQFDYAAGAQPVAPEVMSQFQSPQSTADYFSGYNPAADLPSVGAQETGGVFDWAKGLFPGGGSQPSVVTGPTGVLHPIRGATSEETAAAYRDYNVPAEVQPIAEEAATEVGGTAKDTGGLVS